MLAAYGLAFHFKRPVSELNITMREFYMWLAYLKIVPPEEGARQRTAALMAQITNMSGRSLPDNKTVDADEFLHVRKQQTAEDQIKFMKSLGNNNGS